MSQNNLNENQKSEIRSWFMSLLEMLLDLIINSIERSIENRADRIEAQIKETEMALEAARQAAEQADIIAAEEDATNKEIRLAKKVHNTVTRLEKRLATLNNRLLRAQAN